MHPVICQLWVQSLTLDSVVYFGSVEDKDQQHYKEELTDIRYPITEWQQNRQQNENNLSLLIN